YRHGREERPHAARGDPQVLLDEPLELEQRLVVEADIVDVADADAALAQAVGDGMVGEPGVVLLASEALLLRRGDDVAVAREAGRRVVVERRDAENRGHGALRTAAGSAAAPPEAARA